MVRDLPVEKTGMNLVEAVCLQYGVSTIEFAPHQLHKHQIDRNGLDIPPASLSNWKDPSSYLLRKSLRNQV